MNGRPADLDSSWADRAERERPLARPDRSAAERGRPQARDAAPALKVHRLAALVSSDLLRARQTAEIIGETLGLEVRLEPRLREVNRGDWQGLHSEEIRALAERMRLWLTQPLSARPPNGESIQELAEEC